MGNFFNNLNAKIQTFMIGRNGSDKLSLVCIIAAVVVGLINSFAPNIFLTVVCWALLIYSLFRCFSTNVAARQAENEKFESFFSRGRGKGGSAGSSGKGSAGRAASGRPGSQAGQGRSGNRAGNAGSRAGKPAPETITFQCEQCGQKLSVPKGKGTLKVTCPKCHHQQKVNS